MPDQFRIVRYRAEDRGRVFDLIRAVHRPDLADRLIRQWNWKYDANPFNAEAARYRDAHRDEVLAFSNAIFSSERFEKFRRKWSIDPDDAVGDLGPYILLMKNGAELVAMQASIPQRYAVGGKDRWACIGADLAVHPGYRSRGLALPLTNRLLTEQAMMVGWHNESIQRIREAWRKSASRGQGESSVRGVTYARFVPFVKPLDFKYATREVTGSSMLASAAAMAAAAVRPLTEILSRPPRMPGISVAEIDAPGVAFDQLWDRMRGSYPVMAMRDCRFLRWRFRERPDASYKFLVATREANAIAYLIFREADANGAKSGHLVDFLIEGHSHELPGRHTSGIFRLMLRHAEDRLSDVGAKAVFCDPAPAFIRRTLLRCGYLPWKAREVTYLSGNLNSSDPELQAFADLSQWYVTMADGDRDISF
jgi:predicted N-acetyltransferase YhbS